MDDILAAIYFGQTDFSNRSCTYKGAKKELEAYDKLHETLTKEQLEIFEEFLSLCDDRHAFIQEDAFKRGVKFGFQLCKNLKKLNFKRCKMATQYFRITGYHPTENFCFIIDSHGMFDKMWQFSSFLVKKGIKVIEVSNDEQFIDIDLKKIDFNSSELILRATGKGLQTLPKK